jgi:brp/blh family beta-carotene 15,15'-monooxygenase
MNMKKKHLLILLGSLLLGVLLGMIGTGFASLRSEISQDQVLFVLDTFFFWLGIISTILALYFTRMSRKAYNNYQREEDDEQSEQDYIRMYRFLDYGTVANSILLISMLFSLVAMFPEFRLSLSPFLLAILVIFVGSYCFNTTSLIRNYKLSIMATPKEMLEFLDTYDEGEKQAEMEEAYLILLKINQTILPAIYILLMVLSLVLGEVQLIALIIAVAIHIYINLAQLRKTKRYFK